MLALWLLCSFCPSIADAMTTNDLIDVKSAEFTNAVEYGLCAAMYWGGDLFSSSSPCTRGSNGERLFECIGKDIKCEIRLRAVESGKAFVYVLLKELDTNGCGIPTLLYVSEGNRIKYVEAKTAEADYKTTSKCIARDYRLRVPRDWHRVAIQKHHQYEAIARRLALGVEAYIRKLHGDIRFPQHLLLGPFGEYSGNIFVFWQEQKVVCMVPISLVEEEMIPLSMLTSYDVTEMDRTGPSGREDCKRWWINKTIGNCAIDGGLVTLPVQ